MEKKFKLILPPPPNFISFERPARPRQEGFNTGHSIPVSDLSEEEAEEYGELMKQAFISHWVDTVNIKNKE